MERLLAILSQSDCIASGLSTQFSIVYSLVGLYMQHIITLKDKNPAAVHFWIAESSSCNPSSRIVFLMDQIYGKNLTGKISMSCL